MTNLELILLSIVIAMICSWGWQLILISKTNLQGERRKELVQSTDNIVSMVYFVCAIFIFLGIPLWFGIERILS